MCTLTWRMDSAGYELFFNRDESRKRLPALEPEIQMHGGARYIAPTDADAGGTWIGVNEYGISAALLNYYQGEIDRPPTGTAPDQQSRGVIVQELLRLKASAEVERFIERLDSRRYRPFRAVIFNPGEKAPRSYLWRGEGEIVPETLQSPASSSGFRPDQVIPVRKSRFRHLLNQSGLISPDRNFFYAYHASRDEKGGAYSVCMEREDARTVSFTHIAVDQNNAILYYHGEPLSSGKSYLDKGTPVLPSWQLPIKE